MACGSMKSFFPGHQICQSSGHLSKAKSRKASVVTCALVSHGNTSTTTNSTRSVVEVPVDIQTTSNFINLSRSLIKKKLERTDLYYDQGTRDKIGNGKFGRFGGKFVPETLITCLAILETEFRSVLHDSQFQVGCSYIFLCLQ